MNDDNVQCSTLSYKDQVLDIINNLKLKSKTDNSILKSRFLAEVLTYEQRKNHTKKYYNIFRFIVTTGSILLPAVLSLGQMDPAKLPKNFDNISYWCSWTISLAVTASNGFLQLFSLDKNYFEYAITTEQLKTEGWQYFQLSGKYEDYENHEEGYRPFCKSIENIKRKQVEKEYSGKGEVKKKKEFDLKKELAAMIPQEHLGNLGNYVNNQGLNNQGLNNQGLNNQGLQQQDGLMNRGLQGLQGGLQGGLQQGLQKGSNKDQMMSMFKNLAPEEFKEIGQAIGNVRELQDMSSSQNDSIRDEVQKIKNDLNQKLNDSVETVETVEVVVDTAKEKANNLTKVEEGITPK